MINWQDLAMAWDALARHPFAAAIMAIGIVIILCLLWVAQEHAEEQRGPKGD